jgi:hypothetical protein
MSRGGKWFKPPCHCEFTPDSTRETESHAWRPYNKLLTSDDKSEKFSLLIENIVNSEYIGERYPFCEKCQSKARRRAFVLAVFLGKLRIIKI